MGGENNSGPRCTRAVEVDRSHTLAICSQQCNYSSSHPHTDALSVTHHGVVDVQVTLDLVTVQHGQRGRTFSIEVIIITVPTAGPLGGDASSRLTFSSPIPSLSGSPDHLSLRTTQGKAGDLLPATTACTDAGGLTA